MYSSRFGGSMTATTPCGGTAAASSNRLMGQQVAKSVRSVGTVYWAAGQHFAHDVQSNYTGLGGIAVSPGERGLGASMRARMERGVGRGFGGDIGGPGVGLDGGRRRPCADSAAQTKYWIGTLPAESVQRDGISQTGAPRTASLARRPSRGGNRTRAASQFESGYDPGDASRIGNVYGPGGTGQFGNGYSQRAAFGMTGCGIPIDGLGEGVVRRKEFIGEARSVRIRSLSNAMTQTEQVTEVEEILFQREETYDPGETHIDEEFFEDDAYQQGILEDGEIECPECLRPEDEKCCYADENLRYFIRQNQIRNREYLCDKSVGTEDNKKRCFLFKKNKKKR